MHNNSKNLDMAAAFYTRYVPPSEAVSSTVKKSTQEEGQSPKAKRKRAIQDDAASESKRKESKKQRLGHSADGELAKNHDAVDEQRQVNLKPAEPERAAVSTKATETNQDPRGKSKKKKKEKKNGSPEQRIDQESEPGEAIESHEGAEADQVKHKSILTKFQQSKAIAESRQLQDNDIGAEAATEEAIPAHGLVPLPQPDDVEEDAGPVVSALPEWLSRPTRVSSSTTAEFSALNLSEATIKALTAAGFRDALPVQAAVLPALLPGPSFTWSDICISAATGSGKTLAYALPLIEDLKQTAHTRLRAVIVVPTRELVVQVQTTFRQCDPSGRVRVGTGTGNKSLREEQAALVERVVRHDPAAYAARRQRSEEDFAEGLLADALEMGEADAQLAFTEGFVVEHRSRVDVLVCTPGRLVEHVRGTRGFTLAHARWLVIDEADSLLDQSFQEWTECVVPAVHAEPDVAPLVRELRQRAWMTRPKRVRKIVLSATMTKDVSKLAPLRLHFPKLLVVESTSRDTDTNMEAPSNSETQAEKPVEFELPPTLEEVVISVRREGEKPLYVLELWKDLEQPELLPGTTANGMTSSTNGAARSHSPDRGSEGESNNPSAEPAPAAAAAPPLHGMLVFTNSNESALRLARLLALLHPTAAGAVRALTKSTGTSTGRKALRAFSQGKVAVLVASDRAARGLDLPGLAHVVGYDVPAAGLTGYVHRAGRTARAGRPGRATSLVAHGEARWFWHEIARAAAVRRVGRVRRDDGFFRRISKAMSEEYEEALARLGEEAGAA